MITPVVSQLNANAAGIMNVIRNEASPDYRAAVPTVEQTVESIRSAGKAILAFQPRMNEFVNIANRIAVVAVTSKMYENPWAFMKKGTVEFGETVEEVFVNMVKAEPFDAPNSPANVFKRRLPDVRTMFHAMDLQTKYVVTISYQQLKQAFLSANGVVSLIQDIIRQVYTAARYDEFIMMKYTFAQMYLSGSVNVQNYTPITDATTSTAFVKSVKKLTGKFGFMSGEYNIAGVPNYSLPEDIYCVMTTDTAANVDVDVLANAFNLDKVTFIGRQVLVDSFSFNNGELDRLDMLLAKDPNYTRPDNDDLTALSSIGAIICDRNFPQFYDNLDMYTEQYNADGLSWNEFYHVWRTYSASPFSNVVYLSSNPSGTFTFVGIGGTPLNYTGNANTPPPGAILRYHAVLSVTGVVNQGIIWSVDSSSLTAGSISIDDLGYLYITPDAAGSFQVKGAAAYDNRVNGKSFEATITGSPVSTMSPSEAQKVIEELEKAEQAGEPTQQGKPESTETPVAATGSADVKISSGTKK